MARIACAVLHGETPALTLSASRTHEAAIRHPRPCSAVRLAALTATFTLTSLVTAASPASGQAYEQGTHGAQIHLGIFGGLLRFDEEAVPVEEAGFAGARLSWRSPSYLSFLASIAYAHPHLTSENGSATFWSYSLGIEYSYLEQSPLDLFVAGKLALFTIRSSTNDARSDRTRLEFVPSVGLRYSVTPVLSVYSELELPLAQTGEDGWSSVFRSHSTRVSVGIEVPTLLPRSRGTRAMQADPGFAQILVDAPVTCPPEEEVDLLDIDLQRPALSDSAILLSLRSKLVKAGIPHDRVILDRRAGLLLTEWLSDASADLNALFGDLSRFEDRTRRLKLFLRPRLLPDQRGAVYFSFCFEYSALNAPATLQGRWIGASRTHYNDVKYILRTALSRILK